MKIVQLYKIVQCMGNLTNDIFKGTKKRGRRGGGNLAESSKSSILEIIQNKSHPKKYK